MTQLIGWPYPYGNLLVDIPIRDKLIHGGMYTTMSISDASLYCIGNDPIATDDARMYWSPAVYHQSS